MSIHGSQRQFNYGYRSDVITNTQPLRPAISNLQLTIRPLQLIKARSRFQMIMIVAKTNDTLFQIHCTHTTVTLINNIGGWMGAAARIYSLCLPQFLSTDKRRKISGLRESAEGRPGNNPQIFQ